MSIGVFDWVLMLPNIFVKLFSIKLLATHFSSFGKSTPTCAATALLQTKAEKFLPVYPGAPPECGLRHWSRQSLMYLNQVSFGGCWGSSSDKMVWDHRQV